MDGGHAMMARCTGTCGCAGAGASLRDWMLNRGSAGQVMAWARAWVDSCGAARRGAGRSGKACGHAHAHVARHVTCSTDPCTAWWSLAAMGPCPSCMVALGSVVMPHACY